MSQQPETPPSSRGAKAKLEPATVVYFVGAFFYVVACGPSIGERRYPPVDPVWTAMTFLWVTPILIAETLERRSSTFRQLELALYCFATGFIVSACNSSDWALFMAIFVYPPCHLVVGYVITITGDGFRAVGRLLARNVSPATTQVIRWSIFSGIIVLTIGFPIAFRNRAIADARNRGVTQAEDDWAAGVAVVLTNRQFIGERVWHSFDPSTGLSFGHGWNDEFTKAYNDRISELFRERGVPAWSMKPHLVPDDDLLRLLDSDQLERIEALPHDVNKVIRLIRGPGSRGDDALSVIALWTNVITIGGATDQAYVGRIADRPAVIVIRGGRKWIGAFHEDGTLLSSANRN